MKTKLLLIVFVLGITLNKGYTQNEFWGTLEGSIAVAKGAESGAIFKTDSLGKNLIIDYLFSSQGGKNPEYTKLCEANNGKLYGMTSSGGASNSGVIFEFDPLTGVYKIKHDFNSSNGSNPSGSLVKAPNGLLYGMTLNGGNSGAGVIFEFDVLNNIYTKKFDLGGNYGANPHGSLTFANNGKLYGMTNYGGNYSAGVIFEFNIQTGIFNKKVDFNYTNGAYATGDLIMAPDGKMYGMTSTGGSMGYGNLFEYTPGTNSIVNKVSFDNAAMGGYPKGSLLVTSTNKIYGLTMAGGLDSAGVIFEFDNTLDTVFTRFNLDSTIHGYSAYGNLMEDTTNQRIFGMTTYGGAYFTGTLFEFIPATTSCVVKENFNIANGGGSNPKGTLMQASNNKIYGLTLNGGVSGIGGVLFEYDAINDTILKKKNLNVSDGINPKSSLIKALNGKLYGTTNLGGNFDNGVLYEYDPSLHRYSKLHDFKINNDGGFPIAELLEGSNGKLYGLTSEGGVNAGGTLFEYNISSKTFVIIHHFDTATGFFPMGSLIQIADTLFGMTKYGGVFGLGTIYKIDTAGNSYDVKLDFDGTNYGSNPVGKLLKANNGKLYGMTPSSGPGLYGTLFEYDLVTDTCVVKVPFDYNMANPYGSLIQASNDTIYGLTSGGGQSGYGTLFSYNLVADTAIIKAQFDWSTTGAEPKRDLIEAINGKLYGLNTQGGFDGSGVLFEYDILGDTLKVTSNLKSETGPPAGSLIETGCYTQYDTVKASICNGEIFSFGTQNLSSGGTYNEIFQSVAGCDSIVTLHLIVACPSKIEYWGTTTAGGVNGVGTIYKTDKKGENYTLVYSFVPGPSGSAPYGGLIQADNGKLYGMTSAGGANGKGVIYEFNPALKSFIKKFDFIGTNGANPKGELVKAPNGLLYGMTEFGGLNNEGVVFSYNPNSNAFFKRGDFDSLPSGANPVGSLLLVNDSLFFGVAQYGGSSGAGTIFKYNFTNASFSKILDFNNSTNGSQPMGSLMQANNGLLYGLASIGGANGAGTLFEFDPIAYSCSTKFTFGYSAGSFPKGSLVQASNGLLYGVTQTGGTYGSGTLFEYDFYNFYYNVRANFDSIPTGFNLHSALTISESGNLLGGATSGGAAGNGLLYEFNVNDFALINKHSFNGSPDGANPNYGRLLRVNKYPTYDTINMAICFGDTIYHGPNTIFSAGLYTAKFQAVNGMDSIVVFNVIVNNATTNSIVGSFCQGDFYDFRGQSLSNPGTYIDTVISFNGCDSIITLTLTAIPIITHSFTQSICLGGSYNFGGNNLTLAGTYKDTLPSLVTGCDSIVTLTLNVNPILTQSVSKSICQGSSYLFGGNNLTLAGTYKDTLPSLVTGCDSIVTLTLTVNPIYSFAKSDSICKGSNYILGTQTLTKAGVFTEVFTSKTGCDSTIILTLKVDSLPLKPAQAMGNVLVDNTVVTSNYSVIPVANATSYIWSLLPVQAGGITGTGTSALVTWSQTYSGKAKIGVKGVNSCGTGVLSDTLMVTVTDNPVPQFSYAVTNFDVTFTNTSINGSGYNWDFGDGRISQLENPTHTYAIDGYYMVCLKIINVLTNQRADTCIEIKVGSPETACKAQFTYTIVDNKVTLTNTSTGLYTDVFWDYGDGKYSTQDELDHTYAKPNYYEISLTIFNSQTNCLNTITKVVKVLFDNVPLCNAKFDYFVKDSLLSLTNVSSGNITDYFWDFDDGTYSFEESPEHEFTESGYFNINLTIYSIIDQCMDEQSTIIFIYNPKVAACNAKFSYYPNKSSVTFTSEATGDYSQHFWDFNDGTNSNKKDVVHTFAKSGYYEVSYTVINKINGCFDTQYKTIFVEGTGGGATLDDIKAGYSYVPNSKTNEVKFKDESLGSVTNWYWNFGDNKVASFEQNPVKVYATNDYYRVCLTAGNTKNQETNCKFIAVGDVTNSSTSFFTYFADSVTATGYFKNKSLGNIIEHYWDFGDGNESFETNPSHTYADTGYYAVCLTTKSASGVQKTYCNDVRIGNAIENPCLFSCVWPGDANNDLEANHYDIMTIGLNYNLNGPKRDDATIKWYGQFAQNWSTYQLDGTNNKYGDANGDGIINANDTTAIKQNFAFSHYRQPDVKGGEWQVACVWDKQGSKRAGTRSKATAQLSPPAKGKAGAIYAIGYEIEVIGGEKIKWDSVTVNFANSWMGIDGESMLTVTNMDTTKHVIYMGLTRIDQQNITGTGELAELSFKFKDDVDEKGVSFNVTSKGGIEATGEATSVAGSIALALKSPIEICQGETAIIDAGSGFETYEWSNSATDTSRIEVSEAGLYIVTVTNAMGASAFDTVEVIINDVPVVDLGADITQDGSVELDAGTGFNSYLWSNASEAQTITVSESGEYTVQVSNESGCYGYDTINITITDIKYDLSKHISVYPNPNNGKFWLVYDFNSTASHTLEIINIEGKTVWHNEFNESVTKQNKIEVDNLEKGVYYLKVIQENKVGLVRFVIL